MAEAAPAASGLRRYAWLGALLCLTMVGATGCTALLIGGGQTGASESRPAGGTSDATLAVTVRNRLLAEGSVEASKIDVSVQQGRVTLAGEVGTFAERNKAASVASSVSGVRGVDNRLLVRIGN